MDLLGDDDRAEEQRLTFEVFGEVLQVESFSAWFDVDLYRFFTCDDLRTIAGEKIIRGKPPKYEEDFDELPGVYIFTSLTEEMILKVGQSGNLRQRVGVEHLRDREQFLAATIREYYSRRAGNWPDHLFNDQVTLCVFRMTKAHEKLRLSAELWLQAKLGPLLS